MAARHKYCNFPSNAPRLVSGAYLSCFVVALAICASAQPYSFALESKVAPLSTSPTNFPASTEISTFAPVSVQARTPSAAPEVHKIRTPLNVSEPKFPIGSKFSRTVQTISGINFFTQIVAGMIASKVVERKVGGHVKVKVKVYSLTDLFAGKVKSITIKGRNCALRDVPVGRVMIISNDPIWFDWHRHDGKITGLSAPITMSVTGDLRQQDVCKALAGEALANSLRGLKLDVPGLGAQQLQVLQPKVSLGDSRIQIAARLITRGASPDTGVDLTISAVPVLEGSKIFLRQMKVSSPDIIDPEHFAKFVEDLFNPIIDFGRFDRADHAFRLTTFVVERDKVTGSGNLLLVPRSVGQIKVPSVSPVTIPVATSAPSSAATAAATAATSAAK